MIGLRMVRALGASERNKLAISEKVYRVLVEDASTGDERAKAYLKITRPVTQSPSGGGPEGDKKRKR